MKRLETDDIDEHGVVRPGGRVRVPVTMMDLLDVIQREVASDFVADRPRVRAFGGTNAGLHRPGARFAANPDLVRGHARDMAEIYSRYDSEKAVEFRSSEERLAEAKKLAAQWGPMNGKSDPSSEEYKGYRRKQSARPFEERDPDDSSTCPLCNGSGVAQGFKQSGWIKESNGDDDDEPNDDTVLELMGWNATTHHEGLQRNDVPDHASLDRLRRDHAARMSREYALRDAELSRAIAKADDDPERHPAADGAPISIGIAPHELQLIGDGK